ncbi:MAG: hypothetical protein GY838_15625 [bacterium]|nr:hypothetical protein [bacterium]
MNKACALGLLATWAAAGGLAASAEASDLDDLAAASEGGSVEEVTARDLPEAPLSMSRDSDGEVLRSFTIEGEDRVSVAFDRPRIELDLAPRQAPGLGWQQSWEKVDVLPAVVGRTAAVREDRAGRPWLAEYAQDDVVVFTPEAPEMDTWRLTIVDSRGKPAVVREGTGAPPARLPWNGRRDDGTPAWPGLTYSYVMDTVDPAGNPRSVSGRGFDLPAYRLTGEDEDVMVFSGRAVVDHDPAAPARHLPSEPLMIETASWLNQAPGLAAPIEIRATARSRDQARYLADLVRDALAPMVGGDPDRLGTAVKVVEDAPDAGVIEIAGNLR